MKNEDLKSDEIIKVITSVFDSVVLGNGVGLFQAQAIDDYKSEAEQQESRLSDEKQDWRLISIADLNKCNSSLSFFDAEGMRFHLPAFLVAELKGEYDFGIDFCLAHLSGYRESQFLLLNAEQRASIRELLNYMFNLDPEGFSSIDIVNALIGFWSEEND
ncbi:DUF6714 family protein [Parathalassolituus penaei]|uniref:Uncharacterized protein n=1 Tax=Parathalassolituus penaei TaxID=2997323 RepID=A0A9X3EC13_9GAMM|nr:DUF6714 family protein [Parathalassolituus penaei]MCY0964084.1 hypothetical protein [Parathalassolituus penaei]